MPEVDHAVGNLVTLAGAYMHATDALKRPPGNLDELKPHLARLVPDAETLLRSPRDEVDYVIVWGVDYRDMRYRQVDGPSGAGAIVAYEKIGRKGRHYVVRFPSLIDEMTREALQNAPFPPGQTPSF